MSTVSTFVLSARYVRLRRSRPALHFGEGDEGLGKK